MTLPDSVGATWNAFAHAVDVTALHEADYARLAQVCVALDAAGLAMSAVEEQILEVGGRNGAPEFLAGELMAGVDVGTRAVGAAVTQAAAAADEAATKAAAEAAKATQEAAKAAQEAATKAAAEAANAAQEAANAAQEAAKAAEAKTAALSKLSDEEKKALGLA